MLINRIGYMLAGLGLLFSVSCQAIAPPVSQTPTSSVETTPRVNLTMTSPSSGATATKVPTSTVTAQKMVLPTDSIIQDQCPEISTEFTLGDFAKGTLLIRYRIRIGKKMGDILLNLETAEETSLNGSSPSVSPARDKLVYFVRNETDMRLSLVVQTLGDKNRTELPLLDGISSMRGWHDNQHLLYRLRSDITTDPAPHSIALLDPFTGEKKIYVPNFPDVDNGIEWDSSGPAAYDQTMDYVMYGGAKDTARKIHEYVLWNTASQIRIASLPGSAYNGAYLIYTGEIIRPDGVSNNPPRWSPDDSRVAVISSASEDQPGVDEIFAITKTGETQRLTYFANHFDRAKIGPMNWSPDGKKIAFWVTLEPGPYELPQGAYQDVRLAVLNTETLEITYYCLSGDSIGLNNSAPSAKFLLRTDIPVPIWSPDGKQIVIENRYTDDASRLILLDIPSETAVQIGEDMEPTGWMIREP